MIGIVLAAGVGRRLGPHTADLPKTLLPLDGDRTILDLLLADLAANDVHDVVLVVGHAAERIVELLPALEERYGCTITIVLNDKAAVWNNAYSLWTARGFLAEGALVVNGDTVHPPSVEKGMVAADRGDALLLAADVTKTLGEEEMKVRVDENGQLVRISKLIEPASAQGEYIGVTLVPPSMATPLAAALRKTWESEPHEYYERAFQHLADDRAPIRLAAIDAGTAWVEVDNQDDLARARDIACLY